MSTEALCSRHHLSPHIGVLPGWSWLEKHEHDYDGWKPEIEMNLGGVRLHIKGADHKTLNKVMKANK